MQRESGSLGGVWLSCLASSTCPRTLPPPTHTRTHARTPQAGEHAGHDVTMYVSDAGGCCDCGDPTGWRAEGCCPAHRAAATRGGDAPPAPPLPAWEGVVVGEMAAYALLRGLLSLVNGHRQGTLAWFSWLSAVGAHGLGRGWDGGRRRWWGEQRPTSSCPTPPPSRRWRKPPPCAP